MPSPASAGVVTYDCEPASNATVASTGARYVPGARSRRTAAASTGSTWICTPVPAGNQDAGFHIGFSAKAFSAMAVASTVAPSSAPVTVTSPTGLSIVTSVVARCAEIACAAPPAVRPPICTPATEAPGAMRTSEAAMRATAVAPAGMPIHRPERFFRLAGSGGAQA